MFNYSRNPNRNNNLEIFLEQLRNISLVYENIVVSGDFNIDVLRKDLKFAPNVSPADVIGVLQYVSHCLL